MTALFYLLTAFIWGSTWYGVKIHQQSDVPIVVSNLYRFVIAFICLVPFAIRQKGLWPRLFLTDHFLMILQGFFLYCLNYYCYISSVAYVPSGLTSVAFSTIIIFNSVFAAIFLKIPITRQMILGGLCGIFGLGIIFSGHLKTIDAGHGALWGLLFGVCGALTSSIGHILAKRAQMRGAHVVQNCVYSMGYGILWWALALVLTQTPLSFDSSVSYGTALAYLAVIGTSLAFILYLTVLRDIGPGKAAYIFIISPIVALIISMLFEGYDWTLTLFIGLGFVIVGNVLMLRKPSA